MDSARRMTVIPLMLSLFLLFIVMTATSQTPCYEQYVFYEGGKRFVWTEQFDTDKVYEMNITNFTNTSTYLIDELDAVTSLGEALDRMTLLKSLDYQTKCWSVAGGTPCYPHTSETPNVLTCAPEVCQPDGLDYRLCEVSGTPDVNCSCNLEDCTIDCTTNPCTVDTNLGPCDCSEYSNIRVTYEFPDLTAEDFIQGSKDVMKQYAFCGESKHGGVGAELNWVADDKCKACIIVNITKRPCPHEEIPLEGHWCYSPDLYNWGTCTAPGGFEPGRINECDAPSGDGYCGIVSVPGSQCYCLPLMNLTLDVGNDGGEPWEWENSTYYFEKERVWFYDELTTVIDKINNILLFGCGGENCRNCEIDENGDCNIPFVFRTFPHNESFIDEEGKKHVIAGNITVDDILFQYYVSKLIDSVQFNESFDYAEGANWTFEYLQGPLATDILTSPRYHVPTDCGILCEDQYYTQASHDHPATQDAIDDAMWRLLRKLDDQYDGSVEGYIDHLDFDDPKNGVPDGPFIPNDMWFDSVSQVRTPYLWGPVPVKLVVWI